jgi:hypothetical protein
MQIRYLKVIVPVLLVLAMAACAKPPQADIDAARAAVATAAKSADVVAYAPDTLKSAQDKLAQMDGELAAKHYDKVKAIALEARAFAETSLNDAARNKEKAQADAATLIDALKKALPEVTRKIAAAKRVRGIKLNFTALSQQMTVAKAAVSDAEKDLVAGDYATALQKASAVQGQMNDTEKAVSDAVQVATSKKR